MSKKKLIGYVNTTDLKTIFEEDIKCLDIINIAFGHVKQATIEWNHEGVKEDIARIKSINPNIKLLLSVGGWSSGGFSEAAATKEGRLSVAQSAIKLMEENNLDGLDLDWEYPSYNVAGIKGCKEDKQNFTALIKTLRETFNELDQYYMLTIAAGAGEYYLKGVEMDQIIEHLDYVQLMTYDMRGGFQVLTGHHTNLYCPELDLFIASADHSVKIFHEAGVPMNKLVIGIAFYSRLWRDVPNVDNGMIQMAGTTGGYGPDYGTLVESYINKNNFTRYFDEVAKAPYLFDGSTFISYEDEESITHKLNYMYEKELYGAMYWEYRCDQTYTLNRFMKATMNGLED